MRFKPGETACVISNNSKHGFHSCEEVLIHTIHKDGYYHAVRIGDSIWRWYVREEDLEKV